MKIKIVLIVLCISTILYLQFGRDPYVNNVITNSTPHVYEANLTITMNKIVIFDFKKAKQDIINRVYNNDFENMLFSYDIMGYPQELTVTVYANNLMKYLDIPAFRFRFIQ